MNTSIYSVAQIVSVRENVNENIKKHMGLVQLAAKNHSQIIVFPEMSLTGYEREPASSQCFTREDPRLSCFIKAAAEHNIVIVAGAPLVLNEQLYIASWIFTPKSAPEIYIKKYLHAGEELYFKSSSEYDPSIKINGEQISFAICYDIERDEHVESVKQKNSRIYAAGIFYSKNGIASGLKRLQRISGENGLAVLMSNYTGLCWDLEAGGCSSIWSPEGDLVVSAGSNSECLVIAEKNHTKWKGKILC